MIVALSPPAASTRGARQMSRVPRCEACGREPASSFSWWYAPRSGTWRFTGACTTATESYYILLRDGGRGYLDSTEASARWLLHLAEKRWFNRADFGAMLCRFIAAGGPPAVRRQKGGHPTRLRLNTKTSPKVRLLPTLRVVEDPRP
jgi:hypothetical protein